MEISQESIRVGLVHRALTLGLAVFATSILFTSVAVIFTAAASDAPAIGQVASAYVTTSAAG
jgi:hypothetical protein